MLLSAGCLDAIAATVGKDACGKFNLLATALEDEVEEGKEEEGKEVEEKSFASRVSSALLQAWGCEPSASDRPPGELLAEVLASKLKATNEPAPTPGAKEASSQLLLCRLLGCIQALPQACSARDEVFHAVSKLPIDALMVLATSGAMSKAVLDSFFENCSNRQLVKKLVEALLPKVLELASHFIGQHILKKIYESSSSKEKERIVKCLQAGTLFTHASKEN